MARLQSEGGVQLCSELRACGSFVCRYETLYSDDTEPAEIEGEEEAAEGSRADATGVDASQT